MLSNFLVRNFRSFRELTVERLGRVNLIVGKNSVGKTSLLEAIWLFASRTRPEAIHQILTTREEFLTETEQEPEPRDIAVDIKALFHGRNESTSLENPIVLGPLEPATNQIRLRLTWVQRVDALTQGPVTYVEAETGTTSLTGEVVPALSIESQGKKQFYVKRYGTWSRTLRMRARRVETSPPFLHAGNFDEEVAGRWWDAIALRESEERIIEALRLLVPIERITLIESSGPSRRRVFLVRLRDQKTPQPLKSLGDGVERVFRTALALEYARRNGESPQLSLFPTDEMPETLARSVLLIDEVESGIHYTAIEGYWKMIFALARELNVQVFATTHSWDCIEGFQAAAIGDANSEGVLVRLESGRGKTKAFVFGESDLSVIARERIEVR
jgi:hypothetical protein